MKTYEGKLVFQGQKFFIVVSRFNELISRQLLEGARDALLRHGATEDALEMAWVPGAFEIPYVAKQVAASGKYAAVICLGAVIRGGTPHFDYVASESAKGVAQAAMETGCPVVYGILTTDTIEQAIERAGTKAGNKGFDAAMSALELANLYAELKRK
ncbi:MAG: 6,7-dimethyl-8-ribityllumazine synthase [Candidatus Firestonebacteria bacterium]|nr:6,7-dimethyl-8-ribityllumazine synthase [Candidatus Firestonebacteria bacterium]